MAADYLNRQQIHWFPGHMAKTLRRVSEKLPLVDAVVQLLDARIPAASLNPELQKAYSNKPRLYVLNKVDLADPAATERWRAHFSGEHSVCVAINSTKKGAFTQARAAVNDALQALLQKRAEKGMQGASLRLMITGIPNVGKSTFINNWAGTNKAKAADKPGVTRGEQWINAGRYELLDMPGVLWKKFDEDNTAVNLALIGSIPDKILNTEEMAAGLLVQLWQNHAAIVCERYKIPTSSTPADGWELLELVGRKRGMLISGGEVNLERAGITVLDEFRAGKLGRVTLEMPPDAAEQIAEGAGSETCATT